MKKLVLGICLAFCSSSMQSDWLSPRLRAAIQKQYYQYDLLKKNLQDVYIESCLTVHSDHGVAHYYTYGYKSDAARDAHDEHGKSLDKLYTTACSTALGEGFLIGILVGIIAKYAQLSPNRNTIIPLLIAALAVAAKQRSDMGDIPYVGPSLTDHPKGWHPEISTVFRASLLVAGMGLSIFAIDHLSTRVRV